MALQLQPHEVVLWPDAGRVPVTGWQLEGVGEGVLQLDHLVHPSEPRSGRSSRVGDRALPEIKLLLIRFLLVGLFLVGNFLIGLILIGLLLLVVDLPVGSSSGVSVCACCYI